MDIKANNRKTCSGSPGLKWLLRGLFKGTSGSLDNQQAIQKQNKKNTLRSRHRFASNMLPNYSLFLYSEKKLSSKSMKTRWIRIFINSSENLSNFNLKSIILSRPIGVNAHFALIFISRLKVRAIPCQF